MVYLIVLKFCCVTCLHIPSRLIPTHTNSSIWEPLSVVPRVKLNYFSLKYITSHEQDESRKGCTTLLPSLFKAIVEHVINNIRTMQSLTGISRNTQSKSDKLLLTEFAWVFRYTALEHNNPRIILKAYIWYLRGLPDKVTTRDIWRMKIHPFQSIT